MLKVKKILAFLLASAMMCTAFTACGDSESSSESSSEAESSAEESSEEESSEEASDAEESSAPQQVQTGDFEDAVVPQSGDAYLSMADGQWWLQYTGCDADYLTYNAGVVPITGNGDYTVSVTVDTNAARYDATGDINGELIANGTSFMAVQIMDGADATPNAVIDITAVKVDGTEIPLTKKSFTNTEETEIDGTKHNNIRSNIFNEWVPDDSLPGDARSAEGNIADLANKSDYSATVLDPSAIGDWATIEVNFTISGM